MRDPRSSRPSGRANWREPPAAQPDQPASLATPAPAPAPEAVSDRYLILAEAHYSARRRRERFLSSDLLGEPAWDILLDLYIARKRSFTTSTTSACLGANVPATTALRWLQVLQDRGLIERFGDQRDHRRTLVRLSRQGVAALERYFETDWAAFESDEISALGNPVARDGAVGTLPDG